MFLEYSPPPRVGQPIRPPMLCWVRSLWSHDARAQVACSASCFHALVVLAAMSILGAFFSTTHNHLHLMIKHAFAGEGAAIGLLKADLSAATHDVGAFTVRFAPIYFVLLAGMLSGMAKVWSRRSSRGATWSHCFAFLTASAIPLLWFFALLQLESVAPLMTQAHVWQGPWWNPLSNLARFVLLMLALLLLARWLLDTSRLYNSLRAGR